MKRIVRNGFSLMEMMIVLLIVAIIAAATAPMVTKKMTRHASDRDLGNGESLWEKVNNNNNIIQPINGGNTTISLNPIAIGEGAISNNDGVAIGNIKTTKYSEDHTVNFITQAGTNSVAIGSGVRANYNNSIAIGSYKQKYGENYHDIGCYVSGDNQIAIGGPTTGPNPGEINIGGVFKYDESDTRSIITLSGGRNDSSYDQSKNIVFIPGNLVVGGNVVLGANITGSMVLLREAGGNQDLVQFYYARAAEEAESKWYFQSSREEGKLDIPFWGGFTYKPSDIRLKNVGEKFEAGLEELKKLDFFNYTFKDDVNKTPRVGVMAQDLQKVFPNAVTEGEDGYLRIRMEDMFYAVINAVKELDTRLNILVGQVKMYFDKVDELEKTVQAQNQKIEDLEQRLEQLEKRRK